MNTVYQQIALHKTTRSKGLAVLIDPDKSESLELLVQNALLAGVDYFFVGGSLLVESHFHQTIHFLKKNTHIPVVIFPGSIYQISPEADAILFLSLISGRNPDLLIGNHVLAAPMLRKANIEIIPTGYLLIESGRTTTVHYISNTQPIPRDKPEIASCTAMAGEMLGLKFLYMDAGSGATHTISSEMIRSVVQYCQSPLIVGGGIRSAEDAQRIWNAGADVVVLGNILEKEENISMLLEIASIKNIYV